MHLFIRKDDDSIQQRKFSKKALAKVSSHGSHHGIQINVIKTKAAAVGSLAPTFGIFTWGMPADDLEHWVTGYIGVMRYACNTRIEDCYPVARHAAKRILAMVYLAFDPRTGSALGRGRSEEEAVKAAKRFIDTYTPDQISWYLKFDRGRYADQLIADKLTRDKPTALLGGLLAFRGK